MKTKERKKAIELRKKGLTYNEISKRLNVSKGFLSRWLKNIPYTPTEKTLKKRRLANIRNAQVLHHRKIERISRIKNSSQKEIRKSLTLYFY